ncbi:head-tail adaptor [Streptomyces eurocidicus]|uniref:Head-tail adaptor n=1 Tax=Streptomyces eurocidicus TaxID=66423 RepID=A0A7W8BHY4_STREU|nr:head-tail adaptor [Streptomyces eurocidicus]
MEVHRAPLAPTAYTNHRDWQQAVRVWSGRASVQPDRSFEVRSPARETAQERLVLYLPAGADVDSADRVLWRGRWFEVDGEPARWTQGSLPHVRIRAWRVVR